MLLIATSQKKWQSLPWLDPVPGSTCVCVDNGSVIVLLWIVTVSACELFDQIAFVCCWCQWLSVEYIVALFTYSCASLASYTCRHQTEPLALSVASPFQTYFQLCSVECTTLIMKGTIYGEGFIPSVPVVVTLFPLIHIICSPHSEWSPKSWPWGYSTSKTV